MKQGFKSPFRYAFAALALAGCGDNTRTEQRLAELYRAEGEAHRELGECLDRQTGNALSDRSCPSRDWTRAYDAMRAFERRHPDAVPGAQAIIEEERN